MAAMGRERARRLVMGTLGRRREVMVVITGEHEEAAAAIGEVAVGHCAMVVWGEERRKKMKLKVTYLLHLILN